MNRLLLDQGLPRSAAKFLRSPDWDVVHVCECGLSAATDESILEYARADARTICTLDADFHALLAVSGFRDPSVVRIRREGLRGEALAALVRTIWPEVSAALQSGAMVTVTEHAIRIRQLPVIPPSP